MSHLDDPNRRALPEEGSGEDPDRVPPTRGAGGGFGEKRPAGPPPQPRQRNQDQESPDLSPHQPLELAEGMSHLDDPNRRALPEEGSGEDPDRLALYTPLLWE